MNGRNGWYICKFINIYHQIPDCNHSSKNQSRNDLKAQYRKSNANTFEPRYMAERYNADHVRFPHVVSFYFCSQHRYTANVDTPAKSVMSGTWRYIKI